MKSSDKSPTPGVGEIEDMFSSGGKSKEEINAEVRHGDSDLPGGDDREEGEETVKDAIKSFDDMLGIPTVPDEKLTIDKEKLDKEKREALKREDSSHEQEGDELSEEDEKASSKKGKKEGESEGEDLPPTARTPEQILAGREKRAKDVEGGEEEYAYQKAASNLYKKMSKESGVFLKARLKELTEKQKKLVTVEKELDELRVKPPEGLPPSWYEAEGAYKLTPSYAQKAKVVNTIQTAVTHYTEQLKLIEQGDNWKDLTLAADGNLYLTPEKEATVQDKVSVSIKLQQMIAALNNQNNELVIEERRFQDTAKNLRGNLKQIEDRFFPQYKEPKALEDNKHYKEMTTTIKKLGLQDNLLANLFVKQYAWSMALYDRIVSKEAGTDNSKEAMLRKIERSAGPTEGQLGGEAGKSGRSANSVKDIMEMFERRKASIE
jgi:hypothetical protein